MEQLATQLFSQFFSLPTAVFTVGIGLLVFGIRRIVETAAPRLKVNVWWSEVSLPLLPLVLAVVIAVAVSVYPYPDAFAHSTLARFFFGLCTGGAADLFYAKVKRMVAAFTADPEPLAAAKPS
jgi:uncharacterized membrane protein HdeD (DUF308 family)